jgi:hypothetical protein
MRRYLLFYSLIVFVCMTVSSPVLAEIADANKSQISEANQPAITEANKPQITLQLTTEENQKTILATVTAGGKPLKGATVAFSVKRTFGNLIIGKDQTLDDGTAATPFPADLPGGTNGELKVAAMITDPPQYGDARAEATFGGARVISLNTEEFPRALWAPQAPLALILTIALLVVLVWGTYIYVVVQLVRIRKEGI